MNFAPNLSRAGRAYLASVVGLGFLAIGWSAIQLYLTPLGSQGLQWGLLAILTIISGSASVELPRANVSISISEAFVFTAVLLYGPSAGTLTVALDGLVISFWVARRRPELHRALFNIAAPALSAWCSSEVFFRVSGISPLAERAASLNQILPALILFALVYFGLNSCLIALVIAFQKRQNPLVVWKGGFIWLSLNYFCGASVAVLLVGYNRAIDLRFVAVVVPLLLVLYFTFKTSMQRVEDANRHVDELNNLYLSTIETLAMAIDAKDQVTHGHIRRVQSFATGLATRMGVGDQNLLKAIEAAALLHDMGKLAVPEHILNKPGKLTDTEFDKMKLHASVGADILSAIAFPYPVVPIVRHHHENWDGSGYPGRLRGTDIPIGARILSVVDCFDALTSDRPYRPRLSDEAAIKLLMDRRGTMYDPLVVDTFIDVYLSIKPGTSDTRATPKVVNQIVRARNAVSEQSPLRPELVKAASEAAASARYESERITTAGPLQSTNTIEAIAAYLARLVPSSLTVFYIYDQRADDLVAEYAFGDGASVVRGLRIPRGQRLSGWVAANRQTIANSDPVLDLGDLISSLAMPFLSCLSTPLVSDDRLVGVASLYSTGVGVFTDDHGRTLEALGTHMADALRKASEYDITVRLEPAASLPTLSQLEWLVEHYAVDQGAKGVAFVVLFVKITNFRQIQVRFGATGTDEALRYTIRCVRSGLRPTDILCRHADDELVALVKRTDTRTAESLGEIIRGTINDSSTIDSSSAVRVTASVAVVAFPTDGESLAALIAAARQKTSIARQRPDRNVIH